MQPNSLTQLFTGVSNLECTITWSPRAWPKLSPTSAYRSGTQSIFTPHDNPSFSRARGPDSALLARFGGPGQARGIELATQRQLKQTGMPQCRQLMAHTPRVCTHRTCFVHRRRSMCENRATPLGSTGCKDHRFEKWRLKKPRCYALNDTRVSALD